MRWRAPAILWPLAALPIAAVAGCGAEPASFREVNALQARELAARAGAQVIQVGRGPVDLALPEGARVVEPGWEWPQEPGPGPVVIVGAAPEAGYRLAGRMARAGIQGVAVVAGGLDAWNRERALARSDTDGETESEGEGAWPKSPM